MCVFYSSKVSHLFILEFLTVIDSFFFFFFSYHVTSLPFTQTTLDNNFKHVYLIHTFLLLSYPTALTFVDDIDIRNVILEFGGNFLATLRAPMSIEQGPYS